tara:strand:- start:6152 stop:7360 length:1209 start_codon:yes stop_codon:yes gene_type:complete
LKINQGTIEIINNIRSVVGDFDKNNPVYLHEPDFRNTKALDYVKNCIENGWVSSAGSWVSKFEEDICKFTGASHTVAVTNGTDGLRLALYLVGVRQGDEVIIPPLSFVGTANAVCHLNAIPHFVDIEATSLGMSPKSLEQRLIDVGMLKNGIVINRETGRRISAILPVDVFGIPCDVKALKKIALRWNLPIIEDCAEALGSKVLIDRKIVHCGTLAQIGVISFNGNKLITTGGGGALITNNNNLAKLAKHISTTAKIQHQWEYNHDQVGWNDRMPNINAALGVAQLENIDDRLIKKKNLFKKYIYAFKDCKFAEIIKTKEDVFSNNWLISLRLKNRDSEVVTKLRNDLLINAFKSGLCLRPAWNLLSNLPMYKNVPSGDISVAEFENQRIINLPSSPQLDDL